MPTETIKASEKPLNDVFCDKYLLQIPSYQRPYAWTEEQTGELLSDLLFSMAQRAGGEPIPYFLGSIVLIKNPNSASADVVDGQQRLTTLTILLCVLRDLCGDPKVVPTIDGYVRQQGNPFLKTKDTFRLTPRERDAKFFRDQIQADGATKTLPNIDKLPESQRRMIENAKYLRDRTSKLSEAEQKLLVTYIVVHSYLVTVEASDTNSAYRIFSVMNARGLDLSPTDILKAEVIGALSVGQHDSFTAKWEDKEEALGREKFRDLFGHIRMIYKKSKLRGTLESEFRDAVKPQLNSVQFIDDVLSPFADAYLAICKQDYSSASHAEEINRQLVYLSRIDNYDWEAPTIHFMTRKGVTSAEIKDFLVGMERLAFGLFIMRADINERVNRYSEVITSIDNDTILSAPNSPLFLTSKEKLKVRDVLNGPIYEEPRIRVPVLLRLDEALSSGGATYDHKIITVEHVLPQNPEDGGEWMMLFPDEAMRKSWVHRLGNLALLSRSKNAQASNWPFDRKKNEYFTKKGVTPFAIITQVLAKDSWDEDVLEKRQKELLSKLVSTWAL